MADQNVFNEQAEVNKGEGARLSSFVGAIAIADLVKTTLGPKGMDKILQSVGENQEIQVTNDGATILQSCVIDNPAAKCLIDIAKTQDEEVGDGTTSVTVLAGEFLREAEKLINMRIHPMLVVDGFRRAADAARKALEESSFKCKSEEEFKETLRKIARTTLSSKLLSQERDHFSDLAVNAVMRVRDHLDLEQIQMIKRTGGNLSDSYLEDGFVLDKKIGVGQPKEINNANILIANTPMDTDKIKIFGSRVRVDSMSKVADIEAAEKEKMRNKCKKIVDHGINVFINRQLIYNFPEQIFAENNVMAIEHADFEGVERLAGVTGGEITSTFDHPEMVKLGHANKIEEIIIGEDRMIRFSGCQGGSSCSIILRGSSKHMLDEAERSMHDALCVLQQTVKEPRMTYGGGAAEILMSNAVEEEARKTPGKRQLAMEGFARALRQLPTIVADNAGYDSAELVSQVKAAHNEGNNKAGINIRSGGVGDMKELGIVEPYKLKLQMLMSAAEAAEMVLRVDDIVKCAPRQRGSQQCM